MTWQFGQGTAGGFRPSYAHSVISVFFSSCTRPAVSAFCSPGEEDEDEEEGEEEEDDNDDADVVVVAEGAASMSGFVICSRRSRRAFSMSESSLEKKAASSCANSVRCLLGSKPVAFGTTFQQKK